MKEVGADLGASENADKMRLNRAVETLRGFFTKRGVVVSGVVLTPAMPANSVQAASAVLAETATVTALARGVPASGSTLTLINGALRVMTWTKMKTSGVAAVLLVGVATMTLVVHHGILRHDDSMWPSQTAPLPRQALLELSQSVTAADHPIPAPTSPLRPRMQYLCRRP